MFTSLQTCKRESEGKRFLSENECGQEIGFARHCLTDFTHLQLGWVRCKTKRSGRSWQLPKESKGSQVNPVAYSKDLEPRLVKFKACKASREKALWTLLRVAIELRVKE